MDEEKQQIKVLHDIIVDFENKTWGKLATNTDLARYIVVDKGFRPSSDSITCKAVIHKALSKIEYWLSDTESYGLSTEEALQIRDILKLAIKK